MNPELRTKLLALGTSLTPQMIQGTRDLMAAIAAPADPAVVITRDRFYGPDERNRLDLFRKGSPSRAPVLVYVHGGGFVMGDKTSPGSPFFDSIGQWAAQQGWVGVTLTYRLAPAHRWPCGPEDMGLAVRWLREHVAEYGGDPGAIFLMGQSAGAAHVAAYISRSPDTGLAGALLISGIYNALTQPPSQFSAAYYGADHARLAEANCVPALVATKLPLLFSVSEFDPEDFQAQAAQLTQAWHERNGRYPAMAYLPGHNHLSPAQSIGSAEDQLARSILDFVAVNRP